jgi:predicted transcriptional regulator
MEYDNNTGDCFISDEAMASMFGVSGKTISRGLKVLEEKEFISRETKNAKGGKERHIAVRLSKIEEELKRKEEHKRKASL